MQCHMKVLKTSVFFYFGEKYKTRDLLILSFTIREKIQKHRPLPFFSDVTKKKIERKCKSTEIFLFLLPRQRKRQKQIASTFALLFFYFCLFRVQFCLLCRFKKTKAISKKRYLLDYNVPHVMSPSANKGCNTLQNINIFIVLKQTLLLLI